MILNNIKLVNNMSGTSLPKEPVDIVYRNNSKTHLILEEEIQ